MDIASSRAGAVLELAFDRPQRKNAITAAMYTALEKALAEAEADDSIRVVLFHGNGGAFCAGNDIEDFVANPPANPQAPVFRFLETASRAQKPFVAAVAGSAVGIGTTLLLHCDLVYVAEDARFALPFTKLGLVPEFASSYLLPMIAGYHRAAELLLLGDPFDARTAFDAGFVTRIVPAADVLSIAREAAARLAALPPKSVQRTKALMRRPHMAALQDQMSAEAAFFGPMLGEPAAREAMQAFLGKRRS